MKTQIEALKVAISTLKENNEQWALENGTGKYAISNIEEDDLYIKTKEAISLCENALKELEFLKVESTINKIQPMGSKHEKILNVTVDTVDCQYCTHKKLNNAHGECFYYCGHKNSPSGYGNILWGCQEQFKKVPEWCPLLNEQSNPTYQP